MDLAAKRQSRIGNRSAERMGNERGAVTRAMCYTGYNRHVGRGIGPAFGVHILHVPAISWGLKMGSPLFTNLREIRRTKRAI